MPCSSSGILEYKTRIPALHLAWLQPSTDIVLPTLNTFLGLYDKYGWVVREEEKIGRCRSLSLSARQEQPKTGEKWGCIPH